MTTLAATAQPDFRPDLARLKSVLAVCAHPDDESFGLGAVIATLADAGADVSLLCFTRGGASTLGDGSDLLETRELELEGAGRVLGLTSIRLLDYPDGRLANVPLKVLTSETASAIEATGADALLVFDPEGVSGHEDHRGATAAAVAAATTAGLPVLAWVIPAEIAYTLNRRFGTQFNGRPRASADLVLAVDRSRQLQAIEKHATQSRDNPVLRHRLELMGNTEWLMSLEQRVYSNSR